MYLENGGFCLLLQCYVVFLCSGAVMLLDGVGLVN